MTEHVAKFYDDQTYLLQSAAAHLSSAIERSQVAVVIASGDHRRALEAELARRGTDVGEAVRRGRLLPVDADAVLAACTLHGELDPPAFRGVVGDLVVGAAGTGRPVIVYCDVVTRLWDAGEIPAAMELERLWAEIGEEHSATRFCADPSQLADGARGSAVHQRVYDLHGEAASAPAPGADGTFDEVRAVAEFCANWTAPGTARRWARSVLGRWSLANDEVLDDVALVVTELANNAVLHARSTFIVDVRSHVDLVRISVRDASLSMPTVGAPGLTDRFGRGLGIVAALATSWGVDADADGKVVWAQLAGEPVH